MRKLLIFIAMVVIVLSSSITSVRAEEDIYTISYYDGCGLFSLLITSNNELYSIGDNSCGQLGINSTTTHYDPQFVANDCKYVSVGRDLFAFYISTDNSLFAWGNNTYGQLGFGGSYNSDTESNYISTPKKLSVDFTPVMIDCGKSHALILASDGTVWSAGSNRYGQLGYADSTDGIQFAKKSCMTSFKKIESLSDKNIISVACNDYCSYCLSSDGTLYSFGDNYYGELGIGSDTQHPNDGSINEVLLDNITKVSTYGSSILVLTSNNEVYGFGRNHFNQLGLTLQTYLEPTLISSFTNQNGDSLSVLAKDILCGGNTSFILSTDGVMYATGMNSAYNAGICYSKDSLTTFTKVDIYQTTNIKELKDSGAEEIYLEAEPVDKNSLNVNVVDSFINSCGDRTFIKLSDQKVYSFGDNTYGQVCSGNTATISTPVMSTLYRIQTYEVEYNSVDYMTGPIIVLCVVFALIIAYIVVQEIKIYLRKKGKIV